MEDTLRTKVIALLGIYPKDTDVVKRRLICTSVFIAAMATFAKLWKEPRCPSRNEWIKKMWSIYTMEYYASIRKDEYPTFVTIWMGLEEIILSEIKSSRESQLSYGFSYLWSITNSMEDKGRWRGEGS